MNSHKKNIIFLGILSFLSVFVISFIYRGGDDFNFHVDNISNIVNNFKMVLQGNYFIMPNLTKNLGYGLYIFYPIFPHLFYAVIAKILSYFSVSVASSIIFTNGLVSSLSTLFFYHLSYKFTNNKKIAFVSTLLFIFFPYRISNFFLREAINESFCFVFIPLILVSFLYLEEKKKKRFCWVFCIGYIGLILSHLVISLYFTLFLILYILFQWKKYLKKEYFFCYFLVIFIVSIFVLPNIIMMLEHANMDYIVFAKNTMANEDVLNYYKLSFMDLLFVLSQKNKSVMTYIPLTYIVSFAITLYFCFKRKLKKSYNFLIFIIIILFISLSSLIPWEHVPEVFWKIQFPWRIETILCIFLCLYIPLWLSLKQEKKYFIIFSVFILLSSTRLYYHLSQEDISPWYSATYEYGSGFLDEYLPMSSNIFETYYEQKTNIDVLKGKADIKVIASYPELIFEVSNIEGETIIELPRIYYLGYNLTIDDEYVLFGENNTGLLKAYIYKNGIYTLSYQGTILHQITKLVRFLLIIVLIYYFILNRIGIFKKKDKNFSNKLLNKTIF